MFEILDQMFTFISSLAMNIGMRSRTQDFYGHLIPQHQGAVSIRETVLPGMAIPMLKIRRPNGRLIFNMEIAICR